MSLDKKAKMRNDIIYERFKKGESAAKLAAEYGMTPEAVRSACFYRKYKEEDDGIKSGGKSTPLQSYIKEKIRILKQLGIKPTDEQIDHIKSLKDEYAVDRYCRTLFM